MDISIAAILLLILSPIIILISIEEEGYTQLFNDKDLTGWIIPDGDNGHCSVIDGVIDYDARSEDEGDKVKN